MNVQKMSVFKNLVICLIVSLRLLMFFLFFFIAALITFTTMTRMVEENRREIGTLKALGYTKVEIAKNMQSMQV